jgi:probable HAF family extracellular repeat protein
MIPVFWSEIRQMKIMFFLLIAVCVLTISLGATEQVKQVMQYTVSHLGTLGGRDSDARAINDKGQVVGGSMIAGDSASHAFLYDGTVMKDLGALGGRNSSAHGINNSGQVVGESDIAVDSATPSLDKSTHAFLYDGKTLKDLGTFGGKRSTAHGINDSGLIVGYNLATEGFAFASHAILYDGTTMKDLGSLGGKSSSALAINDRGQVVGSSAITGGFARHAFLYDGTTMKDLGSLGGKYSQALALNNRGQVVGFSYITEDSDILHAFLYDGTTMKDLGTLGGKYSKALAINNRGQIVGTSQITDSLTNHAFLYDNGTMIDLNTLLPTDSGWRLIVANGINDSGQIVGHGYTKGVKALRAFLLTPVPSTESTLPVGER